jgi:hypothetical protein
MLTEMEKESFEEALDIIEAWGVEKYAKQVINTAGMLFNATQKMGEKLSFPTEAELTKMLHTKTIQMSPWFQGGIIHAIKVLSGVNRDSLAQKFIRSNGDEGGGKTGVVGGAEAKKFINFCLTESIDGGIRREAALNLGAVGEHEAIVSLIKTLGDRDIYVIKAAARALGAICDKRAVEPLLTIYNSGLPIGVREAASQAIARIQRATRWS